MTLRYKVTGVILIVLVAALASLALVLSYDAACGPAAAASGEAETMKAVVYRCYGSSEVLEYTDIAKPVAGDDEVLVKVRAAAVNPLDWHYMHGSPYIMRLGTGLGRPKEERLGVDFAGTVEAVGRNVRRFKPGDEVFGGRTGAFAGYVTVREERAVVRKPDNVTFEQAAAVPIAAITALQALRDKGRLQPGQKVLINGASGGVGTFAVQIARSMGAEVTGVCSTRNVALVRSLGASHVIDYTQEGYTGGGPRYDLIIDNVGNHSLLENRKALLPEGKYVMVGGQGGDWIGPLARAASAPLLSLFTSQQFAMMLSHMDPDDLAALSDLMQDGKLVPVIDRQFPLGELAAAIRYSEAGHARGKIVIAVE